VDCRLSFPKVIDWGETPGDFHVASVSCLAPDPHIQLTAWELGLEAQGSRPEGRYFARDPEFHSLSILNWDLDLGTYF
jgi:hypothetical protein